jgi:uncharacterized protein (TIGR02996 family)
MQHHSRIAALAARISALASAGRPSIPGKTVKLRLAAWLEAERDHDVVDVERLLADPWPTQWRDGSRRFERIAAWKPDPRAAALLTRAFVDPPYDSMASHGLQFQMLRHLIALEDPRSREVVQTKVADFSRVYDATYSRFYDAARATQGQMPDFFGTLERIERLEPDAETQIAALEARFANAVRTETKTKKTAAEFLEAIYADPEETAHKAVFADWLTENGDPRGELITLGIARRTAGRTPAKEAERRERALTERLADDHTTWDWPLAQKFDRASRRYEDGFFAGGHLEHAATLVHPGEDPRAEHPGWSHVRVIELGAPEPYGRSDSFDFLARLPRLRELTNIGAQFVHPLLDKGALGQLELIEVVEVPREEPSLDANHPLATTTKLPALKTLGVACARGSTVETLPSWPIVRRVERLMLRDTNGRVDVQEIIAKLANVAGPKTIEVRPGRGANGIDDANVVYRVERTEAVGPFRRLAVRGAYGDIASVLDSFPEASLDFIAMDLKRTKLRPSEQARLREALARFPGATVDPPFDPPSTEARSAKTETVAVLSLRINDANFHLPEEIGRAMRHVSKLGVTFDYYTLGGGNQQRAFKTDPIKKAEAMTNADAQITLYADGTENRVSLGYYGHDHFSLELGRALLDGVLDWVVALIEDRVNRLRRVSLDVEPRPRVASEDGRARADFDYHERATTNPFGLLLRAEAFVVLLDDEWTKRLTLPRWEKHLPSEPALAGLFFRDVGEAAKRRLVGLHADPLVTPTLEEHQAFNRVVHRMVADIIEEMHGYRWRELAEQALAPALAELGLDQTTKPHAHSVGVEYSNADHHRRFVLTIHSPFDTAPELVAQLECSPHNVGCHTRELARGRAATHAEAWSLLERAAANALAERAWFDNPVPEKKKRRASKTR